MELHPLMKYLLNQELDIGTKNQKNKIEYLIGDLLNPDLFVFENFKPEIIIHMLNNLLLLFMASREACRYSRE